MKVDRKVVLAGCLAAALALYVISFFSAGHGAYYYIVVENHSDQVVEVTSLGNIDVFGPEGVQPCTVEQTLLGGPNWGQRFTLTLRTPDGEAVERKRISGRRDAHGNIPVIVIAFAESVASTCPEPIRDRFRLRIRNATSEQLSIAYRGVTLGQWSPRESREVGPLQGPAYAPVDLNIPDSDGRNRVGADLRVRVVYMTPMAIDFGEIPSATVEIYSPRY